MPLFVYCHLHHPLKDRARLIYNHLSIQVRPKITNSYYTKHSLTATDSRGTAATWRDDVRALNRWVHLKVNEHPPPSAQKIDNPAEEVTLTRRLEVDKTLTKDTMSSSEQQQVSQYHCIVLVLLLLLIIAHWARVRSYPRAQSPGAILAYKQCLTPWHGIATISRVALPKYVEYAELHSKEWKLPSPGLFPQFLGVFLITTFPSVLFFMYLHSPRKPNSSHSGLRMEMSGVKERMGRVWTVGFCKPWLKMMRRSTCTMRRRLGWVCRCLTLPRRLFPSSI